MASNIGNQVPYLRTSRNFPQDVKQFTVEVNKAYVDTANAVNNRIIGIYSSNKPSINGESWFLQIPFQPQLQSQLQSDIKQQGLRQVYEFTTTNPIAHQISVNTIFQFSPRCYGSYKDTFGNFNGIIFASNAAAIPGQISFSITPTQIVFQVGGGAPALANGIIVLEWISQI